MSCDLTHSVLHGYLDGELDAARAAEFERHLLSCPQCVAALEAQEMLRSSIQRAGCTNERPNRYASQDGIRVSHPCDYANSNKNEAIRNALAGGRRGSSRRIPGSRISSDS